MKEYWSRRATAITPYTAGEQPKITNIIKLNTNENPYPPSPKAIAAMKNACSESLRLYPDPEATLIREAAAKLHGVDPENIFCGNGSDEVLAVAFQAFFDDEVRLPDISYSFYPVWSALYGIERDIVPLNDDFSLPVDRFFGKPCVIANPNAPTSRAISRADIESIAKNTNAAVVVDEAYCMFGAESAVPLIEKYENIVVIRTLSKSHSLAGLRVGYAVGSKNMIQAMKCIRDSFNSYPVDRVAEAGAAAALLDTEYTDKCVEIVCAVRDKYAKILRGLGFDVLPSKANFLYCGHEDTAGIMKKLREKAIIVRRFDAPRISDYLRITVGTEEQMSALVEALKEILK